MDKSLRQAYDYWQDQPDNSHACTSLFENASSAPGNGSTRPPRPLARRGTEEPVFYSPLARPFGSKPSLPMQEFRNCLFIPRQQSVPAVVLEPRFSPSLASRAHTAAVPLYRPQTTCELADPTVAVTNEPDSRFYAPGFHLFDQSQMAGRLERVTGT